MNPSLNVVTPCYNVVETLRAIVENALKQQKARTVQLVDDTPQDGTQEIMAELAVQYPTIRYEFLAENGGAAKARSWGALRNTTGLVAFLGADDAYESDMLTAAYMALCNFHYLSLVRLRLRPAGFPDHYTRRAGFAEARRRLETAVGSNTVFRRSALLACGGFPQDGLFRKLDGEDAALGTALTRSSVVGTLFGAKDTTVRHVYRRDVHVECLLDTAIFGMTPAGIDEKHRAETEAVIRRTRVNFTEVKANLSSGQTGIIDLQVSYDR